MTIRAGSTNRSSAHVLKVERPYYEQEQFNTELSYCTPEADNPTGLCDRLCNVKPAKILLGIFPVFAWLSEYNIKNDLVGDIVSGCTVAVMHIPQGNSHERDMYIVSWILTKSLYHTHNGGQNSLDF